MDIRNTEREDLDRVMEIYAHAREQMRKNGNPNQWRDKDPTREKIAEHIDRGVSYVIEEDSGICGVFSFILGEEPTYRVIEGEWLNEEPYGTVHCVAGSGRRGDILKMCLDFCEARMPNIRIDTHADNKIMQHLLGKYGFTKCGVIHLADGSPRVAYQRPGRFPV